tara:strand:+ start:125 stop:502 length:378 start_codon:yes stop_codon:yes gene_type:complete
MLQLDYTLEELGEILDRSKGERYGVTRMSYAKNGHFLEGVIFFVSHQHNITILQYFVAKDRPNFWKREWKKYIIPPSNNHWYTLNDARKIWIELEASGYKREHDWNGGSAEMFKKTSTIFDDLPS